MFATHRQNFGRAHPTAPRACDRLEVHVLIRWHHGGEIHRVKAFKLPFGVDPPQPRAQHVGAELQVARLQHVAKRHLLLEQLGTRVTHIRHVSVRCDRSIRTLRNKHSRELQRNPPGRHEVRQRTGHVGFAQHTRAPFRAGPSHGQPPRVRRAHVPTRKVPPVAVILPRFVDVASHKHLNAMRRVANQNNRCGG